LVVVAEAVAEAHSLEQTQMVLLDGTLVAVAEEHSAVVAVVQEELELLHMEIIGILVTVAMEQQEKHQAVAEAVAVLVQEDLTIVVDGVQPLEALAVTEQRDR
jgi:hypothetical protein